MVFVSDAGAILGQRLRCFSFLLGALVLSSFGSGVRAQCVPLTGINEGQSLDVRNILAQAALAASTLPDNFDKADTYQAIARVLWKQGDMNQGAVFFDCAMTVAAKSPPDPVRGKSSPFYLISMIFDRARAGDFAGAIRGANDLSDHGLKNLAMRDICTAAGQQGRFELGEEIAESIPDVDGRDAAFDDLASRSRDAAQFAFSDKITHSIQNDVDRVRGLSDLALALDQKDDSKRASILFAEAVRLAETLSSYDEKQHNVGALHVWMISYNTRDSMLGYVASRQALGGDAAGANETLRKIRSPAALEESKRGIAGNALRQASSRSVSEESRRVSTGETDQRPRNPWDLAEELANSRDYEGALALTIGIDPIFQPQVFEEIARIQVQNGDADQALQLASRLDAAARASTLVAIAEALVDRQTSSTPNP